MAEAAGHLAAVNAGEQQAGGDELAEVGKVVQPDALQAGLLHYLIKLRLTESANQGLEPSTS